jgi:drug/metabolite transporter (DMT)-like permease
MIPLAIGLGVAAAAVYGTSIVVQHTVVHRGDECAGEVDHRHLLRAVRDPRWLFAIGGDLLGFVLQVGALSAGPVVLVQPLTVLMLPVALATGFFFLGHPRPRVGDLLGCAAVVGGLAAFLLLVGKPGAGHAPHAHRVAITVGAVLIAGTVACLAVLRARGVIRGAIFGAVAGACFGTLGVLVDGVSDQVSRHGMAGLFGTHRGLVPLFGILVLGAAGIVLTQASFQIGKLGATLPANLSTDPLTAVVLGAVLLREHLPTGPWHLFGYALCLAAVVAGAIRLAEPATVGAPVTGVAAEPDRSGTMAE